MANDVDIPIDFDTEKPAKKVGELGKAFDDALKKGLGIALISAELQKIASRASDANKAMLEAGATIVQGFAVGGPAGAAIGGIVVLINEITHSWDAAEKAAKDAAEKQTKIMKDRAAALDDVLQRMERQLAISRQLAGGADGISDAERQIDYAEAVRETDKALRGIEATEERLRRNRAVAFALQERIAIDTAAGDGTQGATLMLIQAQKLIKDDEERLAAAEARYKQFYARRIELTAAEENRVEEERTKATKRGIEDRRKIEKDDLRARGAEIEAALDREIAFRKRIADEAERERKRRTDEEERAQEAEVRMLIETNNENLRLAGEMRKAEEENAEASKRAAAEKLQAQKELADSIIGATVAVSQAIVEAAMGEAETEEEKKRQLAIRYAIEAAGEVAYAVASFATGNVPGGIGHAAAAVKFGLAAAMAGANSGSTGGGAAAPAATGGSGSGGGGGGGRGNVVYNVVFDSRGTLVSDRVISRTFDELRTRSQRYN